MQKEDLLVFYEYENFNHAEVEHVQVGPRREVRLTISALVSRGPMGAQNEFHTIRFGKIDDFPKVAELFQAVPGLRSEIGFLGPDPKSEGLRGGTCRFRFVAERVDYEFTFRCGNVTIEKHDEK